MYNHEVFGPLKGRGGDTGGKSDEQLISDLISIHNAENWLGVDKEIATTKNSDVTADSIKEAKQTDCQPLIKPAPEPKVLLHNFAIII